VPLEQCCQKHLLWLHMIKSYVTDIDICSKMTHTLNWNLGQIHCSVFIHTVRCINVYTGWCKNQESHQNKSKSAKVLVHSETLQGTRIFNDDLLYNKKGHNLAKLETAVVLLLAKFCWPLCNTNNRRRLFKGSATVKISPGMTKTMHIIQETMHVNYKMS